MLFLNSHSVESVPVAGESSPSSRAWFHWSWSLCLALESHVLQDHRDGYWWSFHIVINAYFGSCDSVWNSFAQNNGCHWIISVPAVWLQRIIVAEWPAGPGLTFSSLNWKGCENIFQNVLPWFPAICASGTSYQHFDTSKNIEDVFTLWRINSGIFMPYLFFQAYSCHICHNSDWNHRFWPCEMLATNFGTKVCIWLWQILVSTVKEALHLWQCALKV